MRATHQLGLALLLAMAPAACSTSSTPASKSPRGAVPEVAITATTSTSAVVTPASGPARPSGASVQTPATDAPPGRCDSSGLRASLGQRRGAAGTSYVALLLTNRTRVACTLDGYPGVSFFAGTSAQPVGAPAQPDRQATARAVILVPGATVHITVAVADFANYDQQTCQPARANGYRIYPPGSTGSLLVSAPQMVCSRPGVQAFRTSVVLSGSVSD